MITETWMFRENKKLSKYCLQRGIYLTFGDTCVINSIRKADLCHQMCPERLAAKHKTSVPLVRCPRSSWRRPEHRVAAKRTRAQRVNLLCFTTRYPWIFLYKAVANKLRSIVFLWNAAIKLSCTKHGEKNLQYFSSNCNRSLLLPNSRHHTVIKSLDRTAMG